MTQQDQSVDRITAANAMRGQLADRMGLVVTKVDVDCVAGTIPVEGNRQPYGLLHGGASAVLAETLGSFHGALAAGPTGTAVGIELNCSHHRSGHRRSGVRRFDPTSGGSDRGIVRDRGERRVGQTHLHRSSDLPDPPAAPNIQQPPEAAN